MDTARFRHILFNAFSQCREFFFQVGKPVGNFHDLLEIAFPFSEQSRILARIQQGNVMQNTVGGAFDGQHMFEMQPIQSD